MEAVQVQLLPELVQRLRQEVASEEACLRLLRDAGLAMDRARQRALADALMSSLSAGNLPSREQIEAILSRLKVPLSEEVMAMRGEH
jgi:hypothetical protein